MSIPVRTYANGQLVDEAMLEQSPEDVNQRTIEQAIDAALVQLDALIAAPAIAPIPAGSRTLVQLTADVRALHTAAQQNRAGAQDIARTLKRTIRLVRGDFDGTD